MFSVDSKQWESLASGLLSSVTKSSQAKPEPVQSRTATDAEDDKVVELVAVKSDER